MVAYACHPRTREVKAERISSPPELQELLTQKKKTPNKVKSINGKLKIISHFQYTQMEIEILFSSYVNPVNLLWTEIVITPHGDLEEAPLKMILVSLSGSFAFSLTELLCGHYYLLTPASVRTEQHCFF